MTETFRARNKRNKKLKNERPENISSQSEDDSDSLNDSEFEDELDNAQDSTTNIPKQNVKSISSNKHLLELKDSLGIFYKTHSVSMVTKNYYSH